MTETEINLADLDNKTVYQYFIKNKITPNIGIIKWQRIFSSISSRVDNTTTSRNLVTAANCLVAK